MSTDYVTSISRVILNAIGYTTVQEIAGELGCSEKTVRLKLGETEAYFAQFGLKLLRVRGSGLLLQGSRESRQLAYAGHDAAYRQSQTTLQERQIYLLGVLLLQEKGLAAAKAAKVLYISRPTIYKELESIAVWLQQREITLSRSQGKPIQLQCGEKRLRLATIDWYTILRNHLAANGGADALGLSALLHYNDSLIDRDAVTECAMRIERLMGVAFLPEESRRLCRALYVVLPRIAAGKTVTMHEETIARIARLDTHNLRSKIAAIVKACFNITLLESEQYYFYALFRQAGTHRMQGLEGSGTELAPELSQRFVQAVAASFALRRQKQFYLSVENCIESIIGRHQLATKFSDLTQSQVFQQNPRIWDVVRPAIREIIEPALGDALSPMECAQLVYLTAAAIEGSRTPLRAVLIYDSSYSEALYISELLRCNIPYIRLTKLIPLEPLKPDYRLEHTQIVITNYTGELAVNLPVVTTNFAYVKDNMEQILAVLQRYYQHLNDERICAPLRHRLPAGQGGSEGKETHEEI